MAIWTRNISREMHKDEVKTYRFINRSQVNISSVIVEKEPSDLTVSETVSGQQINITISGGNPSTEYEVRPKITFTDGDVGVYPFLVNFWE